MTEQQPAPYVVFSPIKSPGRKVNPYTSEVAGATTNTRALQVLADIEKKLMGYEKGNKEALPANAQVQYLIGQATDLRNLSQGGPGPVYDEHG